MEDEYFYLISCPFCFSEKKIKPLAPGQKVICDSCKRRYSGVRKLLPHKYPLVGELAVQYKTVSIEKLDRAMEILDQEKKKGVDISLEDIFLMNNLATPGQIKLLTIIKEFIEIREISEEFGRTAISMGFSSPEDIENGLEKQEREFKEKKRQLLIGDILIEDGVLTQEQCELIAEETEKNASKQIGPRPVKDVTPKDQPAGPAIDLTTLEKNFLAAQSFDKEFCKNVIQKKMADKTDVVSACKKQVRIFKKSKLVMHVGEILVKDDILTADQCFLVYEEMDAFSKDALHGQNDPFISALKKKHEIVQKRKLKNGLFRITVSQDRQAAYLVLDGKKTGLVKVTDVKNELKKQGIVFGVVSDLQIAAYLKNPSQKEFKIASGRLPKISDTPNITYYFDTQLIPAESGKKNGKNDMERVPRGKMLAETIYGGNARFGIDVFGKKVEGAPESGTKLRCGAGARLGSDGLKVYAKNEGVPRLSIDGKIFVFSNIHIYDNADLKAGPLGENNNITVAGTLTGAYPVKGGDLTADEIRDATIDLIGDVRIKEGIHDAVINTQGTVRAAYVMNTKIYAFGDVIIENELIDSEVVTSGRCIVRKSRIISSNVFAKKGIFSAGIGSPMTNPCKLFVGQDEHIERTLKRIDGYIKNERDEIISRERKINELDASLKKNNKNFFALKEAFEKERDNQKELEKKIEALKAENKKIAIEKAISFLKENNREQKRLRSVIKEIGISNRKLLSSKKILLNEIETLKPQVAKKIAEYNEEKEAIRKWGGSEKGNSELKVKGKISAGTVISGMYSSIFLDGDHQNIFVKEKELMNGEMADWEFSDLKT